MSEIDHRFADNLVSVQKPFNLQGLWPFQGLCRACGGCAGPVNVLDIFAQKCNKAGSTRATACPSAQRSTPCMVDLVCCLGILKSLTQCATLLTAGDSRWKPAPPLFVFYRFTVEGSTGRRSAQAS